MRRRQSAFKSDVARTRARLKQLPKGWESRQRHDRLTREAAWNQAHTGSGAGHFTWPFYFGLFVLVLTAAALWAASNGAPEALDWRSRRTPSAWDEGAPGIGNEDDELPVDW
jgi:hypothetical protein